MDIGESSTQRELNVNQWIRRLRSEKYGFPTCLQINNNMYTLSYVRICVCNLLRILKNT